VTDCKSRCVLRPGLIRVGRMPRPGLKSSGRRLALYPAIAGLVTRACLWVRQSSPTLSGNLMKRMAIAVVLVVFVIPATAFATQTTDLSLKTRIVYYRVYGSTESALRSSLNRHPTIFYPPGEPSIRFPSGEDAYTRWLVNWHYNYQRFSHGCRLTAIKVWDSITIVFPKWQPLPGTSSALVLKWNTYMRHVRLHEDGHKQNSITAGMRIERDLRGLSSFPSCSLAAVTANRMGYQRLKQANQADIAYDARTRHGATQGAIFP